MNCLFKKIFQNPKDIPEKPSGQEKGSVEISPDRSPLPSKIIDFSNFQDEALKQSQAGFTPTPDQIAFAEAYIQNDRCIDKTCKEIGDEYRNRYYGKKGWHYDKDFQKWLSEYCKNWVLKKYGDWYLVAQKYANKGSFSHLNLLMQLAKEFCPEIVRFETNIHFTNFSDEQLIEKARKRGVPLPSEIERGLAAQGGLK